ncbi:MAG: hypothetical protein A2Z14_02560 [Chloroflexi bacterium RBG_16_48_8]|nr:MAG: hypothetical protein A2Z14_02560 [Chloroflexi bacterium RBG_16_48_8]
MAETIIQWLLDSDEPWTRYRTMMDLLGFSEDDPRVQEARHELLEYADVKRMIEECRAWPGYPLKRHNDAGHPLYKFSTLADFGVRRDDPGMSVGMDAVLAHPSLEGPFQVVVHIPKAYGGTDEDMWTWMACDSPTLLYALMAMGVSEDSRIHQAVDHLVGLAEENGWRCHAAPELGKFRGPGRKDDPCPIANVYMLKTMSLCQDLLDSPAASVGLEMLLGHWEKQAERKIYLFGIGTDFKKLKYPFVWYDILHVLDVLSRYSKTHKDPRFLGMVKTITNQADDKGRYTAGSMYQTWKGWSFADKKQPSPWLTFLVLRILKRIGM